MASTEDTQLLIKSTERLETLMDKLSARLDAFPVTYISRSEYDTRHAALDVRVRDLEIARISLAQRANEEHAQMMEKVATNMTAMEQRIQGRFDTADQKLDEKNLKKWDWRVAIIVVLISLTGSGLLQFLPHLWGK